MKAAMKAAMNHEKVPEVDKIKKFNWEKIKDKPGEFLWLHKDELYIPPEYQRAECNLRKQNRTLLGKPFEPILIKLGPDVINAAISKELMILGGGGSRVEANALLKLLNKQKTGLPKLRLLE